MTFLSFISLSFIPSAANFFILSLWYIWCSNNASENADLDISNICLSTRPFFFINSGTAPTNSNGKSDSFFLSLRILTIEKLLSFVDIFILIYIKILLLLYIYFISTYIYYIHYYTNI